MKPCEALHKILESCVLCPRMCRVNRLQGELGFCGIGAEAVVSSAGPHFGEEPPLVGRGGSGTIFFAGCNLLCLFCQNYDISHYKYGSPVTRRQLADTMLRLQRAGCHNINFVTPTHVTPQIVSELQLARGSGLTVPTVYNCGGYERIEILRLLEGVIDIYMPDAKYLDSEAAAALSQAPDYPEVMKAALKEMYRQVGDLEIQDGLARKGLLVRHLVMSGAVQDSLRIVDFLVEEISPNTYVNVMKQYRPQFEAHEVERINRHITASEYWSVYDYARQRGLRLSD